MNVLILTPDRVGSTLLQRLITVYMQAHTFDRPVINLHELTNGLIKYYSPTFNAEVLGKPNGKPWGYYQSLTEITDMLNSVEHYKTSRLAHYHIKNRQDSIAEQVPFYQYLNDNFFIISAQRENLLEHALSWCIYVNSKKLNVYSHDEKVSSFAEIYKNKITVMPETLVKYLDQYTDYQKWVNDHFTVSSYFKYEQDVPRIEEYILDLPIFNNQPQKQTWKGMFDLEFSDWNRCHYLASDLSGISQQLPNNATRLQLTHDTDAAPVQYELQSIDRNQIAKSLSAADQRFMLEHGKQYVKANMAINELVENKILVKPIPIKLQTMLEKRLLIKNFDECVGVYNEWVSRTGVGKPYGTAEIEHSINQELEQWHNLPKLT